VLNNELLAFQLGRPLNPTTEGSVTRGGNGRILLVNAPALNLSGFKTSGIDLDFSWNFEAGNTGDWRWWVLGSHVNKFEVEPIAGAGFQEIGGLLGAPENRVNTGIDWSRGNWTGSIQMNWIDSTSESASSGLADQGHVSSWTTWDIQVGYAFGWDGKITLGIRNVDDRDPPVSNAFGHPRWSFYNYDIFGRVPYVRYEQDL
jgi:iron complex outermembrane receptor protein